MLTRKGFTLIEVLIVVIILGILATIAIPQFAKMTSRARLAEAWTNIGAIRTAQSVYYLENSSYATGVVSPGNSQGMDIDIQSTNFQYTVSANAGNGGYDVNAVGNSGASYPAGLWAYMEGDGDQSSNVP